MFHKEHSDVSGLLYIVAAKTFAYLFAASCCLLAYCCARARVLLFFHGFRVRAYIPLPRSTRSGRAQSRARQGAPDSFLYSTRFYSHFACSMPQFAFIYMHPEGGPLESCAAFLMFVAEY